ncbi:MAG TPA: hypothetical protein VGG46_16005 [Terriglobales bacterium]
METQLALKIMRALASGVHPHTGNALPSNSLYREPEVIKALNRALGTLTHAEEKERQRPANSGRYWSHEEDVQICEEVRKGLDFRLIAKAHQRSVGSIVARLVKLGKIHAKPGSRAA